MKSKRAILQLIGLPVLFIGLGLGYYHLILDSRGQPYCHKQIMLSFECWMIDSKNSNAFPNIGGRSADSVVAISDQMNGHMDWVKNYRYVPGLQKDDPGDLVLMYVAQPTRWTWHGQKPTIFKDKAWIVVPVDFTLGDRPQAGPGEESERISPDEFQRRLRRTVDFIRTNQRPNWQTVVAEHTKFLEAMKPVNR